MPDAIDLDAERLERRYAEISGHAERVEATFADSVDYSTRLDVLAFTIYRLITTADGTREQKLHDIIEVSKDILDGVSALYVTDEIIADMKGKADEV